MSGCHSCSGCAPNATGPQLRPAEKLEKVECSDNPRYPHVIVGQQAIYSDDDSQLIVTVLEDNCDDACDCFTLEPQQIIQDKQQRHKSKETFDVSQAAEEPCWKLQALI